MPYTYEYINKLEQFGTVAYTLKIKDTSNTQPDNYVPVILALSENTEENLNEIASKIIEQLNFSDTPTISQENFSDQVLLQDVNLNPENI